MFTREYDPEAEQECVEDALPDVTQEKHEWHIESQSQPFHWYWKNYISRAVIYYMCKVYICRV